MVSTAILTVGIPASGKSTWARAYASETGAAIVCRDDIRIMQGLKHGDNEQLVTEVEHALIEGLIAEGKDFIVADTNVNRTFRNRLIKFCHQRGADVEIVTFPISLDEAILRDANREDSVGPEVVRRMHDALAGQQVKSEALPVQSYAKYEHGLGADYRKPCIVVDIDGTIARHHNRNPYDYSKVGDDEPIRDVIGIVQACYEANYKVVFASGRDDSCRKATADWIYVYTGLDVDKDSELHMRKTGDQRPDWIIKNEIYDEHIIPFYNIEMVFDDREQVVHHLRRRGITVAQVAPGRF